MNEEKVSEPVNHTDDSRITTVCPLSILLITTKANGTAVDLPEDHRVG